MKRLAQFLAMAARAAGSTVFSFALWTLWLALVVLLGAQIYIFTASEVAVPGFVLTALEERASAAGFKAKFGRTSFDLTGRLLVHDVGLSLPSFAEPVIAVRSAYVRLDPLMLAIGVVQPSEVRLSGVTVAVPAMLSPSGRPEELVRDVELVLEPERRSVHVRQFSGRLANLTVFAHGRLALAGLPGRGAGATPLPEFVGRNFPEWCRRALAAADMLRRLESPSLELAFSPSESGAVTIDLLALARKVTLTAPVAAEARDVSAATRLLLFGETPPSTFEVAAAGVTMGDAAADGVQARIAGRLRGDAPGFDLREALVTADRVNAHGGAASAFAARLVPRPLPVLEIDAAASILGAPLAVQAVCDVAAQRATARFQGTLAPGILDLIARRTGAEVRRFFDFDALTVERAEARFADGGRFESLVARVALPVVRSSGITLTDGRTLVEVVPGRLRAPEAYARIGDNFARGTYDHEFATNRFRFLLAGRLRPLEISGWFRAGWWRSFFSQLEFPAAPPDADVDVQGVWRDGRHSGVFVFADAAKPVIRGADLDRVRTRLFIRQGFVDGLDVHATRGEGAVVGRFAYTNDPAAAEWRTVDLAFDSSLDLPTVAKLVPPAASAVIGTFALARPPQARVTGRFAHPNAAGGAASRLKIDARSTGDFRYHGFPLRDVSFKADLDRDNLSLDDVHGTFASGRVSGHVRLWGSGAARRLGFDLSLSNAQLGEVVTGVNGFFAARRGVPAAPPGKFVQEKANVRVELSASAEGRFDDPFGYRGSGSGVLHGAEIGEVPLLGALSGLLRFTALRFTEARGNFKIEGPRLVFPSLTLRGANSAIDGHGSYALDRRDLDFNAKILPFQESDNLIKTVVGAVLTPLSNAFEVRLTGSLEKPEWSFANFSSAPAAAPAESPAPKP